MTEWISTKDETPELDKEVLVFSNKNILHYREPVIRIGWYSKIIKIVEDGFFDAFEWYILTENDLTHSIPLDEVTHWMPLPEPPKE